MHLSEIRIGRGWFLPQIQSIYISTKEQRLLLDPDFLAFGVGNQLGIMELVDQSRHYHCHDLYTCRPSTEPFPDLRRIELQGWSALTFHPVTLHQTPSLESLQIGLASDQNMTFIPPIQELLASFESAPAELTTSGEEDDDDVLLSQVSGMASVSVTVGNRPRWTRDWHLPQLKSLSFPPNLLTCSSSTCSPRVPLWRTSCSTSALWTACIRGQYPFRIWCRQMDKDLWLHPR